MADFGDYTTVKAIEIAFALEEKKSRYITDPAIVGKNAALMLKGLRAELEK